jgi:hypothetical protein
MSEEDFAARISSETPWWAKALDPKSAVYLAAGIVGVPSIIAISAGWFIAQNVNHRLNVLDQYTQSALYQLNEQGTDSARRWEVVANLMRLTLQCQVKACIHEAKDAEERDECLSMSDYNKLLEKLKKKPK